MMTTCAAATIVLALAVFDPPNVTGNLFERTSNDYKELVEKLVTAVAEIFWPSGLSSMPYVKVTSDSGLGELRAKECDAKGATVNVARKTQFYVSRFCDEQAHVDCRPTIRAIFDEAAQKKSTSALRPGVYAKCVDLKTSLGITTSLNNCN